MLVVGYAGLLALPPLVLVALLVVAIQRKQKPMPARVPAAA
jgi:hypothetical protein